MSIGKNIAHFRKNKGVTQEELGQRLGVTNQAVSKWESEVSMPDVMLIPKIAKALDIALDDLFAERMDQTTPVKPRGLDMEGVHKFPNDAQISMIDTLCRKTNLVNSNSGESLGVALNSSSKKYYYSRQHYTLCCWSNTAGAAFVSDTLTMIDSAIKPAEIGAVFEKTEIASAVKKLADVNVRCVLSYVCNLYFSSRAPFESHDPEYFAIDMKTNELSHSLGISAEDVQDALERLISLHIVEVETGQTIRYLLHKVKVIEAAVSFRLIERLLHNEVAFACGEFLALMQH